MTLLQKGITRRHALAATGAGVLAAGLGVRGASAALETVRQGYQTNMWGMPTYYLMRSGYLEKHGIKFEEFAVPSGNLTMQQMVARQVDMGTYAGPSLVIGNDKGGLVAIAMIEYVGKTARVMARKDLGITKVEQLRGKKVANQTGSSTGNIFVDQIAAGAGLHKGDYQEIRMNVNDMVAAMAAKTVDAMVNVEPYNAIAEADGMANTLVDFYSFDKLPVFMAATPEFIDEEPANRRRLSQGLARRREGLQEQSEEGRRHDLFLLHLEGLQDGARDFRQGDRARRGQSRLAGRHQALYAEAGRNPARGQEDQGHSGLEQGLARGIPQAGQRLAKAPVAQPVISPPHTSPCAWRGGSDIAMSAGTNTTCVQKSFDSSTAPRLTPPTRPTQVRIVDTTRTAPPRRSAAEGN